MAETGFAIFPDGRLTSQNGLKGKQPRSKKQALCDVKNTLQAKRGNGNEPLRKFESDGFCKDSAKELPVKETQAKLTSQLQRTFLIACDEKENVYWDKCGQSTYDNEDLWFNLRPPETHLKDADIKYLAKGIFSRGYETPMHLPEPIEDLQPFSDITDWLDIQPADQDKLTDTLKDILEYLPISDEE